ncbi:MAG: sugar phosphate isomerase/epimerase [Gemmatimonadota bacterium]|nr:MAG: sugar phosphate isomerase/epimerase [Gemmatimonadota bacterium]
MFHESLVCCFLYSITKYGYPPPAEKIPTYLEEMKALGYQSVELEGIRRDHLSTVHDMRHTIKEKADNLGLKVAYFCVVLPGLSSSDRKERAENLESFRKGCEIASVLESRGISDNGPLPPYRFPEDIPIVRHFDEELLMKARFPENLDWKEYWNDLVHTIQDCCDIAGEFNLGFHIHPCLGVLSSTTDGFLYLYDAVKRDNLRFLLDTANQFALKDNLALALRRLNGHVDYIHLSDNRGLKIEHLVPGNGAIHWDTFFETLDVVGFKGHIGIDVGGQESDVDDLDAGYIETANWLTDKLNLK